MTLRCLEINYTSIPEMLLCTAKQQCRVEFDRDDNFIKQAIARAIGEMEAATNISIFNQLWEWDITDTGVINPVLQKNPVRRVMVDDGAGNWVDTTAVELGDPFYFGRSRVLEPYATKYRFEAGYGVVECMPPTLVNPILLITAHIYENRESVQFGSLNELPDMTRRILTGLWLPTV